MLDNLNSDEMAKLVRRIEKLEAAAPVGFTAVSRGALRITSDEGLIVEGSARISGRLLGDGELTWTGPITFTGPFTIDGTTVQNGEYTVTGPFHVNGTTDINGDTTVNGLFDVVGDSNFTGEVTIDGGWHLNGDGDITGEVTVTGLWHLNGDGDIAGDVEVTGNVKIQPGGVLNVGDGLTLEPLGAGGGAINFNPTGSIAASALGRINIVPPDLNGSVTIGAGRIDVSGTINVSALQPTDQPPNLYVSPSGRFFRCT